MDLYLVRHGETAENASRVFQGHRPVPLSATGRRQVAALGRRLRGESFAHFVTSDLARTLETSAILSQALAMPADPVAALREVDVGEAMGIGYADAMDRWPAIAQPDGAGKFPGGESFADVGVRALRYLRDELIPRGGERALVVCHGGVVRAVSALLLARPMSGIGTYSIRNASLTILRVRDHETEVVTWNDTAHLGDT